MLNKLKKLLTKPENMDLAILSGFLVFATLVAGISLLSHGHASDMRASSVMIVNRSMTHGGTGIILSSSPSRSVILTNDHVCRAIKEGGVVRSRVGDYQVASMVESEMSDLCMVEVLADLKTNMNISKHAPNMYDVATVSGHPSLYPNVLTHGHVSGRNIIQVMTGIRACTQEELNDPLLGLACMFFNGMPIIKSYESVLVTATIMPGSSGSGVYNSSGDLIGVVFAGSDKFGYAWTVPYEQVLNFLYSEHKRLPLEVLDQELSLSPKQDDSKGIRSIYEKCDGALPPKNEKNELIYNYCAIIKRDLIWRKE